MNEHQDVPDTIFSSSPLRKIVHFDETNINPPQSTTSINLITSSSSTSLSLPLIAEKAGVRFKLLILLLSLFIALIIGFILSLLFFTQLIHVPKRTLLSNQTFSTLSKQKIVNNNTNYHLFEQLDPLLINELDFTIDICENFYGFVCQKWLTKHPLSSVDFKRSWLTEKSKDIREKFAKELTYLSQIHVYNHHIKVEKNQTEEEIQIDDFGESTSVKNELEHFYSFHDNYDNTHDHKLIKREINSNENNLSQSILNMFEYYNQCLHTSESILVKELQQLIHKHFWFTNNYEIISTINNFDIIFEQMIEHPLMRIWNINTINLGTQIIIHIQRQIQDNDQFFLLYQIEQANLFEKYLKKNHINLCYQSYRVGSLTNTLKEYNELLILSLLYSNSSITDDLDHLISNKYILPIIYSSVRHPNNLRDLIQFMLDKQIIQSLNNTYILNLFLNFTHDLDKYLLNIPIFRSTILYQCQLYLNYYIYFRSLNETKLEIWLDYITSSIIYLIIHSWPGDASYICLYSTIVRHNQLEIIPYWNKFISYTKKQIKDILSPIITVEIRLIDFYQLDTIFRFLFADHFAHYCNLMVYKYGPKLLPFISIFHDDIQISLKKLWKQFLQENSKEQISIYSLPALSNHIPIDCLSLLEYYYPYTLSSFYEEYMLNKTTKLYSIAYELRDLLINNSNKNILSSLQFHIKPERLKLFHDLSSITINIPYEYYLIDENYFLTSWNIIENFQEELVKPIHEFFEINAHHTIEQGIFLQPTIAELYSNETTRLIAFLLIAHELGHALCSCGRNLIQREYFADIISLYLIIIYNEQISNQTNLYDNIKTFFIMYGQSECINIDHDMISFINKEKNFINLHINQILKENEQFQMIFNCSLNQTKQIKKINNLLTEICPACENKNSLILKTID